MAKKLLNLFIVLSMFCSISLGVSAIERLSDEQKEQYAELLYTKITEFLAAHEDCSAEDFDDVCRQYMKENCSSAQTVLIKEKFEKQSEGKLILYRGVSDKKFADDFKAGNIFIGNGTLNYRGSGIYTTYSIDCAHYFANGNEDNIVTMFLCKDANIIDAWDYLDIFDIMLLEYGDTFKPSEEGDVWFDSMSGYLYRKCDEFNLTEESPTADYRNMLLFLRDNDPEYQEQMKNRTVYFTNKKVAMVNNHGLLARLMGFDVLHTDEFDEMLDMEIQEYLVLDAGVLAVCA